MALMFRTTTAAVGVPLEQQRFGGRLRKSNDGNEKPKHERSGAAGDLRAWWHSVLRPTALDDAADSWVLPHFFLPFLAYYFLRIWWVALLVVYVWESIEHAALLILGRYPFMHTKKTDEPERLHNSLLVDPLCGATGVGLAVMAVWLTGVAPLRANGTDAITVVQLALLLVSGSHSGSPVGFYFFAAAGALWWGVFYAWNGSQAAGTYVFGALTQLYVQSWFVYRPLRFGRYVFYGFNAAVAATTYAAALSFAATFGQPVAAV
jgi:hypothetical protein